MEITKEIFDQQRRPRFGNANPERMQLAFWEWMIRGDDLPPGEGQGRLAKLGWIMREGILKSVYGPYRARDLFKVPLNRDDGPIWTFERMGRSRTDLPDGRVVCVAGEHEDYYDPDFCIYNDVVVFSPSGQIEIYGYPREVFPPTDFHTATLRGDKIIIIGCMGYQRNRRPGHTPVYLLDLSSYRITNIETLGESPGWISRHSAEFDQDQGINIRGGEIVEERKGEQCFRRNIEDYALDVRTWVWRRLTNRNWLQFLIRRQDDRPLAYSNDPSGPEPAALVPRNIEPTDVMEIDWNHVRFTVDNVPVSLIVDIDKVEVTIEGSLSGDILMQLTEDVRARTEVAVHAMCVFERV